MQRHFKKLCQFCERIALQSWVKNFSCSLSLMTVKAEKFTLENIQYCQHFVNYMSTVRAENIKFYDECGFNLNDCNQSDGHSEKGTRAIEIVESGRAANYTLMLFCSIEGIDLVKVIVGPADTLSICSSGLKQTNFQPHLDIECLVLVTILLLTIVQYIDTKEQRHLQNFLHTQDHG